MTKIREWTLKTIHDRCTEEGECWIWSQGLNNTGYPMASIEGKPGSLVRRKAYELSGRTLKPSTYVASTCGEKRCCNPAHLVQMTKSQILKRCYSDGSRSSHATYVAHFLAALKQNMAKLDWAKVADIRQRLAAGETVYGLAREYNVAKTTIRDIKHNRSWKVQGPLMRAAA